MNEQKQELIEYVAKKIGYAAIAHQQDDNYNIDLARATLIDEAYKHLDDIFDVSNTDKEINYNDHEFLFVIATIILPLKDTVNFCLHNKREFIKCFFETETKRVLQFLAQKRDILDKKIEENNKILDNTPKTKKEVIKKIWGLFEIEIKSSVLDDIIIYIYQNIEDLLGFLLLDDNKNYRMINTILMLDTTFHARMKTLGKIKELHKRKDYFVEEVISYTQTLKEAYAHAMIAHKKITDNTKL